MSISLIEAFAALPDGLRVDLVSSFREIVKNYREHRWEPSELNGGKFCEAAYTVCLGSLSGAYDQRASKPKDFKRSCEDLERKFPALPHNRSARILIPRMMLGLYDIRNNRGVGHLGGEVNPNHMDATAVLYSAKWIMAELVRLLHSLPTEQATSIIESIVEREISWVWTDGDIKRVIKMGLTLKQQTLVLLLASQGTVKEGDLVCWLERPDVRVYRRDVLRKMHRERLIEYGSADKSIRLLPPGVAAAETLVGSSDLI